MRLPRLALLTAIVLTAAAPAFADATAFIGNTSTPSGRQAKGIAIGTGLLVVGFEGEYSSTSDKPEANAPALKTGMGNILFQTPGSFFGIQPYFTTGGGIYRETLGTHEETQFGVNTGGGVKVTLIGPLRVRFDYRVFKLRGAPLYDTVHRIYAGINLKF